MYKVLLVDDNTLIRKSIRKRIPWDELDMECIGEASNGQQACEQIETLSPDIVITDIKMPKADGFYAIRKTREHHPGIQFIVISGYDDFSYLKQSVQLQVINYILKPIDTNELLETLQQAKERIQKYLDATELEKKAADYKTLYDQEKLDASFRCFLLSSLDFQTFSEQLGQLSYPLLKPTCFCLLLNTPDHAPLPRVQQSQIESRIEHLSYPANCVTVNLYHSTIAFVVFRKDERPLSEHFLHQCQCAIQEIIGGNFPIYLSCSKVVPTPKMRKAYQEALKQMLRRFLTVEPYKTVFWPETSIINFENKCFLSDWEVAFGLQLFNECSCLLHSVLEQSARSLDSFAQTTAQILVQINRYTSQNTMHTLFGQPFCELYMLKFSSLSDLEQDLCAILEQLNFSVEKADVGDRIVQYLQKNFTKPLTLQALSDLFHLNQIYLGQIIKKKTGQPFNKFLNSLRVDYAAQCIRQNPEISFKDLAFSIGFTDPHYFTKVFKQYYHVLPSEYRLEILQQQSSM